VPMPREQVRRPPRASFASPPPRPPAVPPPPRARCAAAFVSTLRPVAFPGQSKDATKPRMPSFDVVSRVDLQEVDNALNQTRKEVAQRYDLKDAKTEIDWDQKEITITSADDFKLKAVVDVLQAKLGKRNVPIKNLTYGTVEQALGGRARQKITVQQGIESEKAREI